ncbi:MAG: HD domain-containing protein [Spirochaetota bacterium]
MLKRGLIQRIYDAATIQRWNDHARPFEIVELDKQAHKMVIAYLIAKFEELERGVAVNWLGIIEGGIFEFLHRVILTDIKPTVFHRMMEEKGEELNRYVLKEIEEDISGIGADFRKRFESYFFDPLYYRLEKRILQAAHYLATNWEFRIIYHLNPFIYGIENTRQEIENRLEDFYDLLGVQKISMGKKSHGFIDLCGQLRFQKRWSGTPRIPQTSVLGHMLIVALFSYICSLSLGICDRGRYNNFFGGLFHDIAEVLTRDIISPIKHSVAGLDGIIKDYESIQVEERLLPLLSPPLQREIRYFIEDEFENRIMKNSKPVKGVSSEEILGMYNKDSFSPLFGTLLRACDELAAFIEARLSIRYGVKSPGLLNATQELRERFREMKVACIDFGRIVSEFDSD